MDAVTLEDWSQLVARVMAYETRAAGFVLEPHPPVLVADMSEDEAWLHASRNMMLRLKRELYALRDKWVAEALSSAPRCLLRGGVSR